MTRPETDPTPDLLVVCGPTASGKTALAVHLARLLNGEIISADSRQVYRGLDIGSGKDLHEYTLSDDVRIPVHLIDIADPRDIYTLHHYQRDCYRAIAEVRQRSRLPILCGGTGLYIEAVIRGFILPDVPEDRALRNRLMRFPREELAAMLAGLDLEQSDRTDLNSKKRIVRAIEVATFRRNTISPETPSSPRPPIEPLVLCTRFKRADLRERIRRRLAARFDEGMIGEVQALRASGLPDERLFMLGMEYRHLARHLRGETDYDTMVHELRQSIYHLAKRQDTWFRGMERRGTPMHWIDDADFETACGLVRRSFPA